MSSESGGPPGGAPPGGAPPKKGRFGASFAGTLSAPQGLPGTRPPPPGSAPPGPMPPGSMPPPGIPGVPGAPSAFPPGIPGIPGAPVPPGIPGIPGAPPPNYGNRPEMTAPFTQPQPRPPSVAPPAGFAARAASSPPMAPPHPHPHPSVAPPPTSMVPPGLGATANRAPSVAPPVAMPLRAVYTEHPLMVPMYWACSEAFTFASTLATGTMQLRSATEVRSTFQRLFHALGEAARTAGITPEDVRDAQYALVALFDEMLSVLPWEGRNEWYARPLQVLYFNENTAGEGFFQRLYQLTQQPHRAHVTQVYFVCLGFGFQGRYAQARGEGLAQVYDHVAASLAPFLPPSEAISPRAVPPDAGRSAFRADTPIVRLSLAVLGGAVLLVLVLKLAVSSFASGTKERMMGEGTQAPASATKP